MLVMHMHVSIYGISVRPLPLILRQQEEAARARAELASVQAAKESLEREAEAFSEQLASAERREATVAQHFRRYVEMTEEEMQRPLRVEPRDAVGSPREFRM